MYCQLFSSPQDFVAQCIGVRYVGFAVAVWAFGSAIGSFMAGRTVIYVQRFTLFIISTGLSIFLSLFLIYFERVESFALVFLVSLGFGLSGMLKTGISCKQCLCMCFLCACFCVNAHVCLCGYVYVACVYVVCVCAHVTNSYSQLNTQLNTTISGESINLQIIYAVLCLYVL